MLPTVNQKELEKKNLTWHIVAEVTIQTILQLPKFMLYLLRTGLLGNLGPNSSVLPVWPTELTQNHVPIICTVFSVGVLSSPKGLEDFSEKLHFMIICILHCNVCTSLALGRKMSKNLKGPLCWEICSLNLSCSFYIICIIF